MSSHSAEAATTETASADTSTAEATRALIRRYFAAVDAEDLTTLREVLDPDISLTACGSRPRDGIDDVIKMFSKIFELFPGHSDSPGRLICEDDHIVAEIHFKGRSAGGVDIAFEAVDVFEIHDGRIVRLTQWFDSAALARQLLSEQQY